MKKIRVRTGYVILAAIALVIGTLVLIGPEKLLGPDVSFCTEVTCDK